MLARTGENAHSCDISVIIPAKNEEKRLPSTLKKLIHYLSSLGVFYEVIVVNDGSRDNTINIAKSFGAHVITHARSEGIASAFRTGVRFSKGRIVMLCPADVQDFSFLNVAIKLSLVFDVVSISKRHPKSIVLGYSRWRWFLSNAYNRCINVLFEPLKTCSDTHYVKIYNGKIIRNIIDKCRINGPVGETEIMLYVINAGCNFVEIPARIIHEKSHSKTSFALILRTIKEIILLYFYWRLRA